MYAENIAVIHDLLRDLDKLKEIYPQWKFLRRRTIEKLKDLSKYLHGVERRVSITNVTTAAVGIPLGVTAVVSGMLFLAAPVTGGFSAFAGVVLAGSGVSGAVVGAIGIAANLVQYGIKRSTAKELETALKEDSAKTQEMAELLEQISKLFETIDTLFLDMNSSSLLLTGQTGVKGTYEMGIGLGRVTYDTVQAGINLGKFVRGGEAVADAALDGVSTLTKLSRLSRIFAIAGIVGSGLGVTFDVFTLVWNSIKLHKGSKCDLGDKIDKVVEDLENETGIFSTKYESLLVD